MIVIIANWSGFKTRPNKLDYNFFTYLKTQQNNIVLCENNDSNIKKTVKKSDIIVVYTCFPDIRQYKNKKIYWIYDLNCTCRYGCDASNKNCGFNNSNYSYILQQNFDNIWYKYETPITKRLSNLNITCYKFSHMMFDKKIHKDYNLEKKYDVLFYGAIYPECYPFRNRLYHLLKKNANTFNIKFLPFSKRRPEKMVTGIELNKEINQSWLTIATSAISNCLLAKYFEIGLCGSVILGDYPEYESEQYIKQNIIEISRHMSDTEILNIIKNALENKKALREKSENTRKYISENYMYENGLYKFNELVNKLIN